MLKSPENRKLKPIYLKRTLTLEDNDPLKVLFYDKEKASKDAENLLMDLKNLSEDQLKKFIEIQNSKISTLEYNYQTAPKKYSVAESAENKFWARLKTSGNGFCIPSISYFRTVHNCISCTSHSCNSYICLIFNVSRLLYSYFFPLVQY